MRPKIFNRAPIFFKKCIQTETITNLYIQEKNLQNIFAVEKNHIRKIPLFKKASCYLDMAQCKSERAIARVTSCTALPEIYSESLFITAVMNNF